MNLSDKQCHIKRVIVISGINLRSGGPLTIIKDCLEYLSNSDISKKYTVIALVHKKELFDFPNINYIEFPKSASSWFKRVYYEYYYFKKLSKKWKPYLWLSLHDMTPRVEASRQAVYMHNPSIVNKIKSTDWKFDKTYIAFAVFYKYLYRLNIHNNNYCIVQQNWFKESCSKMLKVPRDRFIIARPNLIIKRNSKCIPFNNTCHTFFFPSFPRPFKNFETLCEAARILEDKGIKGLKFVVTLDGSENAYAKWIYKKYKDVKSIEFKGILSKEEMMEQYEKSDCLIFPSRLETWGLPISEFIPFNRPIIMADEPYAHETAEGAVLASYFTTNDASELAQLIIEASKANFSSFKPIRRKGLEYPFASDYKELFDILLGNDKMLVTKISNKYSLWDKFRVLKSLIITKLKYTKQRLVRQPFTIRGGYMIRFGKGLTTGVNCRLEAFIADGNKSVKMTFGDHVQLNDNVHISAINSVSIGNDVLMASHVYISDNSHGCYDDSKNASSPDIPPFKRPYSVAPVRIGDRVWLGEGVIIMPGVNIGDGSIIGAHSIVNKDIPENCIAVGSPAKVIKRWDFVNNIWIKV